MARKRILLLSPYDVASHQYWWQGLRKHLDNHEWTILTLPPRYFAWRMRGNSLIWAKQESAILEQDYDLLIACSLTDLSSLRGFIPKLADISTIVYFHENQFAYPENNNRQEQGRLERQMIQVYNGICADGLVFNSAFNRDSFFEGLDTLLRKLPDLVPPKLQDELLQKTQVLPVPLDPPPELKPKNTTFTISWNHRWEYDKGLETLSLIVGKLIRADIDCYINILGQGFRTVPEAMKNTLEKLANSNKAGHLGFIEKHEDYLGILSHSHLVLSSSLHEFQGIAVMEAVLRDCVPVLPKRLSYPEFFPEDFLYSSNPDPDIESDNALAKILAFYQQWQERSFPNLDKVKDGLPTWDNKKAAYQQMISSFLKNQDIC